MVTLFLCCFSASCINDEPEEGNIELTIGDAIPDFQITLNSGNSISNTDLLGKVSLLIFFHTACKDCQQEFPILQRFYENNPTIPLICISRAESDTSIVSYWESHGLTMPYSAQDDRTLYNRFAKSGIPRIYITDHTGIIRRIFTDNPLATYEELTEAVKALY